MESRTIKEFKNLSLNRIEYVLDVKSEKNPSKLDIVVLLKSDAELTVVKKIKGSFGKDSFTVNAVVYNTAADKTRVETIPRKVRKKAVAEAKKAAEEARKAA
jgi:ribosomal protein S24E